MQRCQRTSIDFETDNPRNQTELCRRLRNERQRDFPRCSSHSKQIVKSQGNVGRLTVLVQTLYRDNSRSPIYHHNFRAMVIAHSVGLDFSWECCVVIIGWLAVRNFEHTFIAR